ncbi:MFS transporter [Actinomadura alba]|uniref:MFS transporter n=1 Tax=Actinomadura alba TaxID=406431 RepID=A0ABR7LPC7_9ACTN|nr:MFS transporter [Actinomadura alba]MBC6466699.1 MFS transporter [Actinomadura alba]
MGAPLRGRDMRLLFGGLAVSMFGDSLMLLVFAIWVKTLTGSNSAAGLVLLFVALPCAAAPLGGWLVDRFPRRRFLIGANLASALMLLPLLAVHGRDDVWIIYLVAALYGISWVAITSALNGLLKELVAEEALATANGALQTVKEGLRLGGPLVGAALFATLGGTAVAAIDAATFLAAAASIAAMRLRERSPERAGLHLWDEMTAGLRHLAAEPVLRRAMTAGAIAWLVVGLIESVSFAIVDQGLHRPPEFIGVLASAQGAGCIAAGIGAARIIGRVGELAAIAIGLAAFGTGCGLCIPSVLTTVLAGKAMAGAGITLAMVGFATVLQKRTPQPLIGRVSTAAETMTSGPQTISLAAGAALISLLDYRLLLATIVLGMLTAAVHLWSGRRLTAPARAAAVSCE